jgi:hypothetical protein
MNYTNQAKQLAARYKIGTEFMDKVPTIAKQFEGKQFGEFYPIIDNQYKGIRKFILLSYMWMQTSENENEYNRIHSQMKSVFEDYLSLKINDKDIDNALYNIVNS